MPNGWQKDYDKLKDYIDKNPGIEIEPNVVCISSDIRPEFYHLFNAVCASFIKDNFAVLLEKSYVLRKRWGELSRVVTDSLKLEAIDVDPGTSWFLSDPDDGLTRGLIDPLFDLLKGKNDLTAFEQTALRVLEGEFTQFSGEGYQCWAIMSLLKLLSTDKIYQIPVGDFDMDPSVHAEEMYGSRVERVPDAVEINRISFVHRAMYSYLVPKVIGHSTRLNRFVAFCRDFNFNEARWQARGLSPEQEWYGVSDIVREFGRSDLWPDLAIYTGTHWKELVVIADHFKMARPDIVVEFRVDKDWYEKEGLEKVKRHYDILKPKLGSFVVCLEPVPAAASKELEEKPAPQPVPLGTAEAIVEPALQPIAMGTAQEIPVKPALNIHLLSVGYDITKLEPVVEAIMKAHTQPEETTAGNTPA